MPRLGSCKIGLGLRNQGSGSLNVFGSRLESSNSDLLLNLAQRRHIPIVSGFRLLDPRDWREAALYERFGPRERGFGSVNCGPSAHFLLLKDGDFFGTLLSRFRPSEPRFRLIHLGRGTQPLLFLNIGLNLK